MKDPLRRLNALPWRSLLRVSAITVIIIILVEVFFSLLSTQSFAIYLGFRNLYRSPFGLVVIMAVAAGVGALAVYLLERLHQRVFINIATLWALIPCLILVIFLKSLLPIYVRVVELNTAQLIGLMVGVFWRGRPYWR